MSEQCNGCAMSNSLECIASRLEGETPGALVVAVTAGIFDLAAARLQKEARGQIPSLDARHDAEKSGVLQEFEERVVGPARTALRETMRGAAGAKADARTAQTRAANLVNDQKSVRGQVAVLPEGCQGPGADNACNSPVRKQARLMINALLYRHAELDLASCLPESGLMAGALAHVRRVIWFRLCRPRMPGEER